MACQRIHQWFVIILKAGVEMNFKQYKRLMERKTVITDNIKRAWLLQTPTGHVLGATGETDSSPQLTQSSLGLLPGAINSAQGSLSPFYKGILG